MYIPPFREALESLEEKERKSLRKDFAGDAGNQRRRLRRRYYNKDGGRLQALFRHLDEKAAGENFLFVGFSPKPKLLRVDLSHIADFARNPAEIRTDVQRIKLIPSGAAQIALDKPA